MATELVGLNRISKAKDLISTELSTFKDPNSVLRPENVMNIKKRRMSASEIFGSAICKYEAGFSGYNH
ncbi:MAG: hypothetical protein V4687_05525 [Bacteroidota bacterium]